MAFAITVALAAPAPVRADQRLFRPLTADPRENQTRWHRYEYVEDWRYGTDVGDSTSQGGILEDVHGLGWEVAAGEVFRWRPLERIGPWRGPWRRYQLGALGGMFTQFDGGGIMMNSDYQYGFSADVLWRGDYDPGRGIARFSRTVVTSRVTVSHRSSHLGDEYLVYGAFGRNRDSQSPPPLLDRPPVKRAEMAYEAITALLSAERSIGPGGATLRGYGGGEFKLRFPSRWRVGGTLPTRLISPAWRAGLEVRSAGDAPDPPDGMATRALTWLLRDHAVETEWFGAVDMRIAKPFRFASSDNPDGETEVWTPYLWTLGQNGREFRNAAASWHAMLGMVVVPRARRVEALGGGRMGPEWIVALEWYRGYSPNGQFQDQRLSYNPRWGVVPSVTAHF
jgi:hypothetical protein